MFQGQIIRSTGSWYDIRDEHQAILKGRLRGKLKLQGLKVTNPVAVGDLVTYDQESDGTVCITNVIERRNYLVRKSTHKTAHGQILAANIDLAVIVASLASPRTSTGFIDRFLVAAEWQSIPALIIFNKVDQLNELGMEYLEELLHTYQGIGYQALPISAVNGEGLEAVMAQLAGKLSLITGHSGVGKSTLINHLIPEANQKTAQVSTFANKGVHTTTYAEIFEGQNGMRVIDTPGIKELGVVDIPEKELDHCFPEIAKAAESCKFYNCTHLHEPGCDVVNQVENDHIPYSRYKSYVSIMTSDDNRR